MWFQSLGGKDPLEGMALHSSILAWRIPWAEEPGGLQSTGCKELGMTKQLNNNIDTEWGEPGEESVYERVP